MPFAIVRNDITKMEVDAIVNAANKSLKGGGGVDGAIHAAAGPELLEECRRIGGIETGEAVVTGGYRLPAKYVIHTAGPVYRGGIFGEERLLKSCYIESLKRAEEKGCRSVAFPLISAGAYHYPREKALDTAIRAIREYLSGKEDEPEIYLVIYDRESFRISSKKVKEIRAFIDDRYVEAHPDRRRRESYDAALPGEDSFDSAVFQNEAFYEAGAAEAPQAPMPQYSEAAKKPGIPKAKAKKTGYALSQKAVMSSAMAPASGKPKSLDEWVREIDESFTEMLLRKIDEKGMTDAECYKKANIDRKLFSKIRMNPQYKPKKVTALAFAIALELPLAETQELLGKAGYTLSKSSKFDLIIEYFILNGNYDIFDINEALFHFDQVLLGA